MTNESDLRDGVVRLTTVVERLVQDTREINEKLEDISEYAAELAVLKERQTRIEKLIFGVISLVLTAVVVAIMALVLEKRGLDRAQSSSGPQHEQPNK